MMIHMTEKKGSGQRYTEEFRAEAVRLLSESSKSARQVAEEIGVNVNSLQAWVKRSKTGGGADMNGAVSITQLEELRALRKENRELRMERDFLKKTAEYFASQKK